MSTRELLRQIGYPNASADLDARLPSNLGPLALALDMDPERVPLLTVPAGRGRMLLGKASRNAYCPLCFKTDWDEGRIPYFRLIWAVVWITHCPAHGTPLFEWGAMAYGGQRRLPHVFFLRPGEEDPPPWVDEQLHQARQWECLGRSDSGSLWRALRSVESRWLESGMGDPTRAASPEVKRHETTLLKLLYCLMSHRLPERPCLARRLAVPPGQHRVLGYDERRMRIPARIHNFNQVRSLMPALPARRALLILAAHTLGHLDHELHYDTGARLPAARSMDWEREVTSYRVDRDYAERTLRAARSW